MDAHRPAWIGLATDGPLLDLPATARVVGDPAAFLRLLAAARPSVAVVAEPPASADVLDALVAERRRRSHLRIVHLAADDAIDARLAALRLGFDEALPSSIAADELAGRLAVLADRARARPSAAVALGDGLELDPVAHRLVRDGTPIHLRPKEYGLLAALAAHPGRAYTRRQLLDRVWGHDREGSVRTVDVHVRWLRAKIERDPSRPTRLVTLRGVGYRLDTGDG